MKTKNLFHCRAAASGATWVLPALIAGLNLVPAGRVTAQTFTTLHSFTGSDGANPYAGLITDSSGNTLYGTAVAGGSSGEGVSPGYSSIQLVTPLLIPAQYGTERWLFPGSPRYFWSGLGLRHCRRNALTLPGS